MFRYLYKDKNPLAGLVRRQYVHFKWEEQGYISSLLARTRVNRLKCLPDALQRAYEDVNILEIDEHYELAKSDHVEQTFKLLNALNKATLSETDIVLNKRYEDLSKITAIVDPDKFPIFSLIETIDTHELTSVWEYKKSEIMPKLQSSLGFTLEISASSLEHHSAGDGVFLRTSEEIDSIPMGQLLGFVGGISYETLTDFYNSRTDEPTGDEYLHRFDNTIIDFSQKIPYPFTYGMSLKHYYDVMGARSENEKMHIKNVPARFINPYSIGDKLNHPPKHLPPNVILIDMHIPRFFFTESFMKFFPYMRADLPKESAMISRKSKIDQKEDHFHAVGIFALRDIKDGEELFVDYIENSMYDVEIAPDWLVKPPPLAPEYRKENLEFEFSTLAKVIDQFVLSKQLSVYDKFKRSISHDPSKEEMADQTKLLSKNHPKLFQKFLKQFEDDAPVKEGHFANKIKANKNKQQQQ